MRFSSRLVALLIGVSVIGGATYFYTQHQQPPVTKQQQVKTPLTVEQIDKIADRKGGGM